MNPVHLQRVGYADIDGEGIVSAGDSEGLNKTASNFHNDPLTGEFTMGGGP